MFKRNSLILGIALMMILSSINSHQELLPLVTDELKESSIDLRPVGGEMLYKNKTRILQNIATPIANGTSAATSNQVAIPESSKKWKSRVIYKERQEYEKMLKMKNSFQASLSFLPKSYMPESKEYLSKVSMIALVFLVLSGLFFVLIIIFLILRFCCNKCKGPVKTSQVTRAYRNITWFLMIGSLCSLITVYIFLLTYSIKINNALISATNMVSENVTEIGNEHLDALTNLTLDITETSLKVGIDLENFNSLKHELTNFTNITQSRIDDSAALENYRSISTIIIFVFYLMIAALAFLAFSKRWSNFLLGLSIILLFSLPLLLLFEGVIASYYFVYSDVCQEVHDAIYANKFPIADKGLGYLVSCFNAKTKSNLYTFAYELVNVEDEIKLILANNVTSSADFETFAGIQKEIKNVKEGPLNDLLSCSHVYDSVHFFEERFCVNGMNWANNLISSYSWLVLIILFNAYAINRMKPVVEKKNSEIESMLMNEEFIE